MWRMHDLGTVCAHSRHTYGLPVAPLLDNCAVLQYNTSGVTSHSAHGSPR